MLAALLAPLLLALFAFAWSAFLAGVADAAALAIGGDEGRRLLAAGFLLICCGLGARRPRPAGRDAWFALLWAAAAALALPFLASGLAGPAAGSARSASTAVALLVLLASLGWPAARLGALLAARLEEFGPGCWNPALFGAGAGLAAVVRYGLGPRGTIVVALLLALSARVALRPGARGREARPAELAAPALFSFSLVLGLLFLLPHLELFDGSSAAQDGARLATLAGLLLLGALTLGAAAGESRAAGLGAAVLGALFAAGWSVSASWLGKLSDPAVFNGLLQGSLTRGLINGGKRLAEGDGGYVPVIAVLGSATALLGAGAALRASLPSGADAIRPARPLAAILIAAGAGMALALLGHPELTPVRAPLAALAALAGAAAAAWAAPQPRRPILRLALAAALVAAPLLLLGLPADPATGVPFFDNFQYTVKAEVPAVRSIARVVERTGGPPASQRQLWDGRNSLGLEPEAEQSRRMEALFALALAGQPGRALLAGSPHPGTVAEWRGAGVGEIGLVTDPPELVQAAQQALPGWERAAPDHVYASAGAAEGRYGLILLRDETPWDERRSVLRPTGIATCARRLSDHGVLAVALDPERILPGTVESVWSQVHRHCAHTRLWLLPRGVRTPQLLVTGSDADIPPAAPAASVLADLRALGLPLDDTGGFALLDLTPDEKLPIHFELPLAPPRARTGALLAEVEYRRQDQIRPQQRAALVLARLQDELGAAAQDTLLPFYRLHLESQLYSQEDDFYADTLLTPEAEWVDLGEGELEELLALTRRQPGGAVQALWVQLAPVLLNKREVEWCQRYYGALVEELHLQQPAFHVVLSAAQLESLEPEGALRSAEAALAAQPGSREAQFLRARALAALERHGEAASAYRQLTENAQTSRALLLPVPEAEVLRGYGEEALRSGDRPAAEGAARRLHEQYGPESLGPELAQLLGIELEEPQVLHKEGALDAPQH